MRNLKPIVELCINDLDSTHRTRPQFLTRSTYVREYRTISLSMPRQTGKTTVLLQMLRQHESLMFTRNQMMKRNLLQRLGWGGGETMTVEPIFTFCEGKRFADSSNMVYIGSPLDCILIDEPESERMDWLWQFIEVLDTRKELTEDFFVLMLGTD